MTAVAKDFDPGAFAAAWRGRLGFDLASQGRMLEEGPEATLTLTQLRGELRGRPLSGNANLTLTPPLVASGTLALNSGQSELRFRGRSSDQLDATISLNVASLNDWVPDSGGELQAEFVVRGKWPELSIDGDARGRDLHAANVRVESLSAQADVDDPRNPEGSIRLDLTKLTAAGFEFDTVRAEASGAPKSHRLALRVNGQPLALELDLQGARTDDGWAGSLQNLVVDVKDAARLALREPANIVLGKNTAEVSQACLVDGRIELCAAGALQPDGAIRASYSLANLPLALGNALATAELPIKLEGTLQGHGEIRRTPQGELFGDVLIESDAGSIFRHVAAVPGDETQEPPQKLLGYRGFKIAATLSGPGRTRDVRYAARAECDVARRGQRSRPRSRSSRRSRAACADRFRISRRSPCSRRNSPTCTVESTPISQSLERCSDPSCRARSAARSSPRTFRRSA